MSTYEPFRQVRLSLAAFHQSGRSNRLYVAERVEVRCSEACFEANEIWIAALPEVESALAAALAMGASKSRATRNELALKVTGSTRKSLSRVAVTDELIRIEDLESMFMRWFKTTKDREPSVPERQHELSQILAAMHLLTEPFVPRGLRSDLRSIAAHSLSVP